MSNDDYLLRAVLGDPTYSVQPIPITTQQGSFRCLRAHLPWQGVPPTWDFAILNANRGSLSDQICDAVQTLDRRRIVPNVIPILFISEDDSVVLANILPPHVLYLDATEITPLPSTPVLPRYSPLMMAVRRTLRGNYVHGSFLSPYLRNKPARSWRFFGRHRELGELMHSHENFVVIGSRRIGKTSLLQRATESLIEAGYAAYYVDVQDCVEETQVIGRIMAQLDIGAYASAARRSLLGISLLETTLKKMSGSGAPVLLLDEIGNVISKLPHEHWKLFGMIRRFAHAGGLRVIMSSFQEFFLRQQHDFSGPFVNLASTMRLGGFTNDDICDFVIGPLAMWGDISDRNALLNLVLQRVGRHPLFLQHLCSGVFIRLLGPNNTTVLHAARDAVTTSITETFADAVDEVFYRSPSATIRYLFLKKCCEADVRRKRVSDAIIDDHWIEVELASLGLRLSSAARRNLLEGMEIRGFTEPVGGIRVQQKIICPIVYFFICATDDIERLLSNYREDLQAESDIWDLAR